jgi:hypothetical protein
VILRIVRGHVTESRMAALVDGFVHRYAPLAARTPGLVRYHAGVRPVADGDELVLVTFWSSVDAAMRAYDGDIDAVRTLDGMSRHADLREVAYFEIDESQLRRSTSDVVALRLTVGRVARGIDADIQQELRSHLHELEPAMTEAYVGRRIVGTDVEVAFISAWESIPAGRALDDAFWPDISARYDAFEVACYRPIASGAATV